MKGLSPLNKNKTSKGAVPNIRIQKVKKILERLELDAILVSNPSNIYYLSSFSGHDSYLLITKEDDYVITDFRYTQQAKKEADGFEVVDLPSSLFKKTANLIERLKLKRIGFESAYMSVKEAQVLSSASNRRLHPTFGLIEKLRIIKDEQELKLIKKAASLARFTSKEISKELKAGKTEKEIAARIDFLAKTRGGDGPSFSTIVASGASASMPHAQPTAKRIRASEPIIIDFGVRFKGYSSDLTRSSFVGKIDERFKLIYSIVSAAQTKAIDKIKPGIKISDIDKAARSYILKKGFDKYFGHALGHCIGIDVHELPSINSKNHSILKEGMVFSVEPGIYIPGWGGVRIEDMVLVTRKGCEVLTK